MERVAWLIIMIIIWESDERVTEKRKGDWFKNMWQFPFYYPNPSIIIIIIIIKSNNNDDSEKK